MKLKRFIIECFVFAVVMIFFAIIKDLYKGKLENKLPFNTYLFIDAAGVLHSISDCDGIAKSRTQINATPCPIDSIKKENIDKICSRCITEEQLVKLIELTK